MTQQKYDLKFFEQEFQDLARSYNIPFNDYKVDAFKATFAMWGKLAYESNAFSKTKQEELYRLSRNLTRRNLRKWGELLLSTKPPKNSKVRFLNEEILEDCLQPHS